MNLENLNAIFKKTEKGTEALKIRDSSLPQKLRVLLILIDGKKTLSELTPLLTVGSATHERIKELLLSGFIVEVLQQQTPPSNDSPIQNSASTAKAKQTDADNLQIAIREATKRLSDMLGPSAEVLCIQLEKCRTKDEYNTKILAFRKVIGSMRSERFGDEFVKASIL